MESLRVFQALILLISLPGFTGPSYPVVFTWRLCLLGFNFVFPLTFLLMSCLPMNWNVFCPFPTKVGVYFPCKILPDCFCNYAALFWNRTNAVKLVKGLLTLVTISIRGRNIGTKNMKYEYEQSECFHLYGMLSLTSDLQAEYGINDSSDLRQSFVVRSVRQLAFALRLNCNNFELTETSQ